MPSYQYTAIDSKGKEKSGKIEASSEQDAKDKISAQGLVPTKVTGAGKSKGKSSSASATSTAIAGKLIKQEDLTIFTRQLSTLLESGLPLLRSLETLTRQQKHPKFKSIIADIAENVKTGNNLSDGLAAHPRVFDHLYVSMVKAGEAGGVLDVVLNRLATFQEKSLRLQKKVKAAMVYPIIVIGVAVAIVGALMVFVIPTFQNIFQEILKGAPLPALTQLVIDTGEFVKKIAMLIPGEGPLIMAANIVLDIIVLGALYKVFMIILRLPQVVTIIDRVSIKIPSVGSLVKQIAIARFTRTFGTLLSSGVPILQALTITRDVVGNVVVQEALTTVHDRVRDGETVAAPLERESVFPSMVVSMIDVGEETGELPQMLNRIADNYDEDVDNAVGSITQIIEPIMIVVLAVVVGTIVIALFLPIIEIIKNMAEGNF